MEQEELGVEGLAALRPDDDIDVADDGASISGGPDGTFQVVATTAIEPEPYGFRETEMTVYRISSSE